jgi:hypothetical protein
MSHHVASGKQIAMLLAIASSKGIHGEAKLLEWIEYESGLSLQLKALDDMRSVVVSHIKQRLEEI